MRYLGRARHPQRRGCWRRTARRGHHTGVLSLDCGFARLLDRHRVERQRSGHLRRDHQSDSEYRPGTNWHDRYRRPLCGRLSGRRGARVHVWDRPFRAVRKRRWRKGLGRRHRNRELSLGGDQRGCMDRRSRWSRRDWKWLGDSRGPQQQRARTHRTGHDRGSELYTVTQAAALTTCSYSISPMGATAAASGATATVVVTAGAGCAWSAVSDSPWITVSGAAGGTGNGTVTLLIAANPGGTRSGIVTIAGQPFAITQEAATAPPQPQCTYAVSPLAVAAPATGGPLNPHRHRWCGVFLDARGSPGMDCGQRRHRQR